MEYDKFFGEPAGGGFFYFLKINPLFPEHPPSFSPIFIRPTRYLHFNFADLAINLSIAPEKRL